MTVAAVLQAVQLPLLYKQGRLLAYRLLCVLTVRSVDLPPSSDYLSRFYHVLHQGLVNSDQVSRILLLLLKTDAGRGPSRTLKVQ